MTSENKRLSCFKAYDVRGRVPEEIDEDLARGIGRAYAAVIRPRRVVVGHDIRLSSPSLSQALIDGLTGAGVDVAFLGLCGTEEVYFATDHLKVDGGIMITASHNPAGYNGLKLVRQGSRPISGDSGLRDIEAAVSRGAAPASAAHRGKSESVDVRPAYLEHLLSYIDVSRLKPLKVVANAGNGCAGPLLAQLEPLLPLQLTRVHFEPDGTFPNGVPNPLLPENRPATADAVRRVGADLGVAWDGDFDRCFLFDETGGFIEGYYIVGLLAAQMLARRPGAKILHDPRLTWNTLEMVREAGGVPVQSKTGHAFIKERMRAEDAVYGGEMSAHHYFKSFAYCDSGMIPWLLIAEMISAQGRPMSELVAERMKRFPASGEINRRLPDPASAIRALRERYQGQALAVDETDGVSLDLGSWRFNLRMSNTEPVIRLNVEARGDEPLMREKTEEILEALAAMGASA